MKGMFGKKKCNILREIRKQIAKENDIPYATEECKYKGDCKGTCPKCESELAYLEAQLEKRRRLGLKVTASAVAIGLVTGMAGCDISLVEQYTLAGAVEAVDPDEEITEIEKDDAAFAPDDGISDDA